MYHLQKVFGKSKVDATRLFASFQRKIYGSNGTSKKVVLLFRTEYSKRKFVFHFSKAISDTSFTPSRPFSVNATDLYKWYTQFRDEIYHSLNLIKLNTLKYLSASQDHDSAQ